MSRIVIYAVQGMTCKSCEKLIGDILRDLPGVTEVEVSVTKSKAAIRLRDEASDPDLEALNRELAVHGYKFLPPTCEIAPSASKPLWSRVWRAALTVAMVALLSGLILSPIRQWVPSISASASIGAMFLLGVLASISTCLASTGGYMLAYASKAKSKWHIAFMHLGRLFVFLLGGALLGALGGVLPALSPVFYGILAVLLGIGFLATALNLLELMPPLAKYGLSLPNMFQKRIEKWQARNGVVTPLLVGGATFILPCGFTQTAQALALSSGSAIRGALFLVAFALGTLPVLFGLTWFARKATLDSSWLKRLMGGVMFVFAFGQLASAAAVFGIPLPTIASTFTVAQVQASEQVVKMTLDGAGYSPSRITIKKGVPVRWELDAKEILGCAKDLVARQIGINQQLHQGLNVIRFTPQQTGKISFSCSMGMIRGSFDVVM